MNTHSPDFIRHRLNTLARENFCLWLFIMQNDLFDEAEEFLFNDAFDKIFTRCLMFQHDTHDTNLPWDDVYDDF